MKEWKQFLRVKKEPKFGLVYDHVIAMSNREYLKSQKDHRNSPLVLYNVFNLLPLAFQTKKKYLSYCWNQLGYLCFFHSRNVNVRKST